jgi:FixJ family two-component response regulator
MGEQAGLPILCLEDDRFLRTSLRRLLDAHEVTLFDRVATARASIEARDYAAWLLDVTVVDGTGLELLAWARTNGKHTPALVMTGSEDRQLANQAQALGAEFLYKPFGMAAVEGFIARADAVHRRESSPPVVGAAERLAERHRLPRREHEIVEALMRGIARTRLASELGVSENTMKTYVRRLLERTQHDSLDALLRTMLRGES